VPTVIASDVYRAASHLAQEPGVKYGEAKLHLEYTMNGFIEQTYD